jgi:orotate phosphoribosyltransferase
VYGLSTLDRATLAKNVARASLLTGSFTLRSGATSTEYFDKYQFESDPELLAEIADQMIRLIPTETEVLAGLELGGIPVATALSLRTGLPVVFVRKRAKEYGTRRLSEGTDVQGKQLCIVEDVITSGGQVVESCIELRALGGIVEHVVCVIDRESGGKAALVAAGLELHALFLRHELDQVAGAL